MNEKPPRVVVSGVAVDADILAMLAGKAADKSRRRFNDGQRAAAAALHLAGWTVPALARYYRVTEEDVAAAVAAARRPTGAALRALGWRGRRRTKVRVVRMRGPRG